MKFFFPSVFASVCLYWNQFNPDLHYANWCIPSFHCILLSANKRSFIISNISVVFPIPVLLLLQQSTRKRKKSLELLQCEHFPHHPFFVFLVATRKRDRCHFCILSERTKRTFQPFSNLWLLNCAFCEREIECMCGNSLFTIQSFFCSSLFMIRNTFLL